MKNTHKLFFPHLNINLSRNEFELLVDQIKRNANLGVVSETKSYDSFPIVNFMRHVFSLPYKLECHSTGGRILLHAGEDIPLNPVTVENESD